MKSNVEVKQAIIAFLTAERAGAAPGSALDKAAGNIVEVSGQPDGEVPLDADVDEAVRITAEAGQVLANQVTAQANVAIKFMAALFIRLARDYEADDRPADIDGFLRRGALLALEDD